MGRQGRAPSVYIEITFGKSGAQRVEAVGEVSPGVRSRRLAEWPVSQPPSAGEAGALIGRAGVQQIPGDVFTRHPPGVHGPAEIRPKAFTDPAHVFTFGANVSTVSGEALVSPRLRHGPDQSHRPRRSVRIIARRIRHPLGCRVIRTDHQ